jgi:2-aminoadipate transaminase
MKRANSALSELARRTADPPISWLMKMALDRPNLISLAAGFTDDTTLPTDEVRELLESILVPAKSGRRALQYGPPLGDARLRMLTAERLRKADRVKQRRVYSPDRVLITHGSQQLLYLVTECLCDPGDIVIVEDPTYFVYLGMAQSRGLRCYGIPMTPDGIDLERLEQLLMALQRSGQLPRLKMLYLVSYFQNPSGITTSLATKRAALDLLRHYERAAGHPLYLLEDAAYRELRFHGDDVPSTLLADSANSGGRRDDGARGRVIYAGTYSKPFATGVRVGFGVLPEPLLTVVSRLKGNHDFGTSNVLQQLLTRALSSGRYAAHLPVLQARYAQKAAAMTKGVRKHFPDRVTWVRPAGGLYVWVKLPRTLKTGLKSKLFGNALRRDVVYVPGELCYADDPRRRKPNHEMRLSFGNASPTDIRTGIARLGEVTQRLMKS